MKQIACALILILFCFNEIFAGSCRPRITNSTETDSPCNYPAPSNVSKNVHYYLEWPDGFPDELPNVFGSGACSGSPVCCSQSTAVIECWPLFDIPITTTGGTFSQKVHNRGLRIVSTN